MAFWDSLKDFMDKSIEASGKALNELGEKTKELGQKGVIKFEIAQLKNQFKQQSDKLGLVIYELFTKENKESVTRHNQTVVPLLEKMQELENLIAQKEEEYKKIGGKPEDLNNINNE